MATTYPLDGNGTALQILFPARAQTIAVVTASARTSADFGEGVKAIDLFAAQDCFVKFGSSTVTAATTDAFIKAGVPYRFSTHGSPRIAAIRSTADGTIFITELE